jgi:hypothetical protein
MANNVEATRHRAGAGRLKKPDWASGKRVSSRLNLE